MLEQFAQFLPSALRMADDWRLGSLGCNAGQEETQIVIGDARQSMRDTFIIAEKTYAFKAGSHIAAGDYQKMQMSRAQPAVNEFPESVGFSKGGRDQPAGIVIEEAIAMSRLVVIELIGDQERASAKRIEDGF